MADRLLEPLGMVDTGFHVPADSVDRLTTLYAADDGELEVRDEPDGYFAGEPAFASGPAASSRPSTTGSRSAGCCSPAAEVC